jgi:hypothetical protein
LLDYCDLPFFHEEDDKNHEEENEKSGIEDEPGLKANGLRSFTRMHLDSENKELFLLF